MRNKATLTAALFSLTVMAQDYSISKWYNDYQACMVQTYDDMNSDHVTICTPQLKARGMGGTMFVDYDQESHVNLSGGWQGLMNAADDGMEMANHTQNHADLTAMKNNAAGLVSEITTFRDFLNSKITNQDCNTFAYPYGNGNLDAPVLAEIMKNHIGARDAGLPGTGPWGWSPNWIYNFGSNESDYFHIPTIAEHFLKPKIQAEVDNLLQHGGLMTVMWHAVTSTDHEQFLDNVLAACNGKVWHSNFQDAVKYHRERRVAVLSETSESGIEWVLNLTDTLNDMIFNHPLTIHLKYEDKIVLGVQQNGVALPYQIIGDEVVFNAVPDGGDIVIEKQFMVGFQNEMKQIIGEIFPNPTHNEFTINLTGSGNYFINVYSRIGTKVKTAAINSNYTSISLAGISQGIYMVEVIDLTNYTSDFQRIIKK